jgi:squalene cyclase
MYLKARQMPDGQWAYPAADTRPPICLDYVGQTALSMRALQLYTPKTDKAEYDRAIRMAATWIAEVEPKTNEDRFWKLMGLAWAGQNQAATQKVLKDVLSRQRADGGWSDLPTMQSTAYATGRALVALQTAGVPVTDAAYQRGVQYLMNTQMADGSWHVRTRALGFQPYFDSGYPHGYDQAISAAGSGWATMALTLAAGSPQAKGTTAGGEER